jgi:hypothetical protein
MDAATRPTSATNAAPTAGSVPARSLRAWVVNHDDSRVFLVGYLGLALVLSIAIGLFWLVALVGVHWAFEYVRARHQGEGGWRAVGSALWAVKLDVALVLFALVLALYLKFVLGVLGLQAVGRAGAAVQAGARGGVRFAAWEKVIRGTLLAADDAVQGVRAVSALRAQRTGDGEGDAAEVAVTGGGRRLGVGDWLSLGIGAVCLALILIAPWMGYSGWGEVLATLGAELHPFP